MNISTAVIVAAGKGRRMGTEISKQFLPLCGKEILAHTVEKFEKAACIRDIILVTGGDALQDVRQMVQEYGWKKIISVTEGGKERQDSVFLGLQQVPQDTEIVLIHDGVRPFVTEEILERSIAAAKETGGCVAGVPAKDTIKVCDAEALRLPRRTEAPSGRYRLRRPSAERKSLRHTKKQRRTAFWERMMPLLRSTAAFLCGLSWAATATSKSRQKRIC